MGQCCSCIKQLSRSSIEMGSTEEDLMESQPQIHSIDQEMSAPSIRIGGELKNEIYGYGLALADVSAEPDRAYWEWRVKISNPNGDSPSLLFGVSNKRNAKFYQILSESTVPPEKHGTKFMCKMPNLKDGDVVGVAMQQSEIPMIQLYLNGECQYDSKVPKFRGTVFPSIYIPQSETTISAAFLYREDQFIHGPPSQGYECLIAERSLM